MLKKPSSPEPRRLEWGEKGQSPTISMDYDWICADINTYIVEER